jgi:hypothetical protein
LRNALDWLRDTLAPVFEKEAAALLRDPWAARNDYVDVVLNRADENVASFLGKHAIRDLNREEQIRALKMLEMQRHAMLMYTSCGWFFDELSGLETVQVVHYAGRAIQLACETTGNKQLEAQFREKLREAKSNLREYGNGEEIYKKWVAPAIVTADKVMGHYAISSLFESYGDKTKIYCYTVEREQYGVETEGRVRLAVGRGRVRSEITKEQTPLSFAVLNLGDHNITGGVREFHDENQFQELREKLHEAFGRSDTASVIRILDEQFHKNTFSLRSLFRDEQRRIIDLILKDSLGTLSGSFRSMYEHQAPLMRFLNSLSVPVPPAFISLAGVALNNQLQQALDRPDIDAAAVKALLREADLNKVTLDEPTLEFTLRKRLEEQASVFGKNPDDFETLKRLHALLDVATVLPFSVQLWEAQNLCFVPLTQAPTNDNGSGPSNEDWARELVAVREKLHIQGPH